MHIKLIWRRRMGRIWATWAGMRDQFDTTVHCTKSALTGVWECLATDWDSWSQKVKATEQPHRLQALHHIQALTPRQVSCPARRGWVRWKVAGRGGARHAIRWTPPKKKQKNSYWFYRTEANWLNPTTGAMSKTSLHVKLCFLEKFLVSKNKAFKTSSSLEQWGRKAMRF